MLPLKVGRLQGLGQRKAVVNGDQLVLVALKQCGAVQAAVAAGARVERALEILGDDIPEHLKVAGLLRLQNKQASLEELGQLHQPPLTKDAVAGRIRRLLATADKRAAELGIASTEAGLSADMIDDRD